MRPRIQFLMDLDVVEHGAVVAEHAAQSAGHAIGTLIFIDITLAEGLPDAGGLALKEPFDQDALAPGKQRFG